MYTFKKLNTVNGLDENSLDNARQNNYVWSMTEMDDYIYVGTGRNMLVNAMNSILGQLDIKLDMALVVSGDTLDNIPEIWRYKKDESMPWQRVYKVSAVEEAKGFRFMTTHKSPSGLTALYAAVASPKVAVYKSINGVTWIKLEGDDLEAKTSRSMVSFNSKLYLATMTGGTNGTALLYSSKDPEFYPWTLETPIGKEEEGEKPIEGKNPVGEINNIISFNNKLYVACSTKDGIAVWRTNGSAPKVNDWVLIGDKGFGDSANINPMSMSVFRDMIYVGLTKDIPLACALNIGADVIRINKKDQWQLVVGGRPIKPSKPTKGERKEPISGLTSGFGNPFNVYAWQIVEHKGKLLIGTFDNSRTMSIMVDMLVANKDLFPSEGIFKIVVGIYERIIKLLDKIKYPLGFDLYESEGGINFNPIVLNGLGNPNNYGSRMLMVDSEGDLYIGTANPFQGCEVWKGTVENGYRNPYYKMSQCKCDKDYKSLIENKDELGKAYNELLPYILEAYEKILNKKL